MRRLILLIAFLLAPLQAYAAQFAPHLNYEKIVQEAYWQSRDSNYNVSIASASSYVGPGDAIANPHDEFASCARVLNNALASPSTSMCDLVATASTGGYTAGQAVCTLRGSTSGFVDLSAYCSNSVESGVTPATACGHATSCSVSKMYDESPAGDHLTNATLAQMPTLSFSALNGLPCVNFGAGGTRTLSGTNSVSLSQPNFSIYVVANSANTANGGIINTTTTTDIGITHGATANLWNVLFATGTSFSATDNAYHSAIATPNGASSAVMHDGTDLSYSGGALGYSSQIFKIGRTQGGVQGTPIVCEIGRTTSGIGGTDRTNLYSNQHGVNGYNGGV